MFCGLSISAPKTLPYASAKSTNTRKYREYANPTEPTEMAKPPTKYPYNKIIIMIATTRACVCLYAIYSNSLYSGIAIRGALHHSFRAQLLRAVDSRD